MRRSMADPNIVDAPYERVQDLRRLPAGTAGVGDVWRILWCRRGVIAATVVVCFFATSAYVLAARSQYTAVAQILIDPRDRQIVTRDVNPDTLAADGGVVQVESEARVIESDAVLLRAIRAAGLDRDPDYGAPQPTVLGRLLGLFMGTSDQADSPEDKALRTLRKHLAVKRADKVFVVDVVVTAYAADKAARIADAVANAFLSDQIASRAQSSDRASEALASRLTELRTEVQDAENRVERYKADHDLIGSNKQLLSDQQLDDDGTKLNNARAKTAELRARADQIDALRRSGADGGAIPEALGSSVITQLRASYTALLRSESDMRTRFGDRYPDLIALVAEVKQTRQQITSELDRLARSAHSDLDRAVKNERAMQASTNSAKQTTVTNNGAIVTLNQLNRELDSRRAVYQSFLARTDETKQQSMIDNTNDRILSDAIPPDQPSWPLRGFMLLAALGGGLGLGAASAFVLEYLRPTVLSAVQLQRMTGVPVAGVLESRRRNLLGSLRRAGDQPRSAVGERLGLALSRICGSVRTLRSGIKSQSLLFTSALGDDRIRRAVTAEFVAAAVALNLSVLVVEADLGAVDQGPNGLLDVLRGDCKLATAANRRDRSGAARLAIGHADGRAITALTEEALNDFLYAAGRTYDLIVFAAGALAVDMRIAPIVACVDDVVLVVVQGVTSQQDVQDAAEAVAGSAGRDLSATLLVEASAV